MENLEQLLSYSESTQRVLLQTYLNRFPDLNLTKAQFAEVRQILKSKSQYRHPIKNGYELIKEYQTVSDFVKSVRRLMKRKMNLCYTIKIRYLIKVIYFPLDFL